MNKIFLLLLILNLGIAANGQKIFRSNNNDNKSCIEYYFNLFKNKNIELLEKQNVLDNLTSVNVIYKFLNKQFKIDLFKQDILQTNWSYFNI